MVWGIAYINHTYISHIEKDIANNKYNDIGFAIPQIRMVEKRFKGKIHFKEVPLLFNYGFFQIPKEKASNREFLEDLKRKINGIYSWLYVSPSRIKDRTKFLKAKDKQDYILKHPEDESLERYCPGLILIPKIETVKEEVVDYYMDIATRFSVFSSDDIKKCEPGDLITLQGYPFEGLSAEVLFVDEKRKKVKVRLILATALFREVEVDFENVFYTVYNQFNDDGTDYIPIENIYTKYYEHERESLEFTND